jgi:molybdopterin/thiamine biosynthesis adenylyltransferase
MTGDAMTADLLPQLKHTSPVFTGDGVVYVGGYGEATEIDDPDGAVRRLLGLMDGTRTIPELHRDITADHPAVTLADVKTAVGQFDKAGFLQNAAISPAGMFDEYELRRWERNFNFFGSYARMDENKYEYQRRLRDTTVTLLGLGGLGSHILLDMAAMGVGTVRVVEFDTVEISNLNRQILYRDDDIGKPKIDLAVQRVQEFNPRIRIDKRPGRIESTEAVLDLIGDTEVVISVADRPKMEIAHWVNEACVRAGVPLITGGLETQRAVYYTVIPGRTGCVECWRLQVYAVDPVSAGLLSEKRERNIGGDNAAFCPLVTMTTGLLLGELTRLVTGVAPPISAGRLMELPFDDYQHRECERWERLPDCPVCGHLPYHSGTNPQASRRDEPQPAQR